MIWGVIPAAGAGSRIQPLAFSKELLPVGSRFDDGVERPRAVSEYLIERLLLAGANRLCFVIAPGKSDIMEYYGSRVGDADACYAVQPRPAGLCDALFRAAPLVREEDSVIVGLPDTVWFPEDALRELPHGVLSFLLFPVDRPELFDAVETDDHGQVRSIQVKSPKARSRWVWGAFRMPGLVFHKLHALFGERGGQDEYLGTLVNAYLEGGGTAVGVHAGEAYIDIGTLYGYREAVAAIHERGSHGGRASMLRASRPGTSA